MLCWVRVNREFCCLSLLQTHHFSQLHLPCWTGFCVCLPGWVSEFFPLSNSTLEAGVWGWDQQTPPNMWNSWNPVHYGCSPCFTAPTHTSVVWLAPCLPAGKDTRESSPWQVCVGFGIARTQATLQVCSLWLSAEAGGCKAEGRWQPEGLRGQRLFCWAGAAEPLWSTVPASWPGAEVPFANERPPTAPSGWETQYPLDPFHLQMWGTHQWQ